MPTVDPIAKFLEALGNFELAAIGSPEESMFYDDLQNLLPQLSN